MSALALTFPRSPAAGARRDGQIRAWIYPSTEEIYQLLTKAAIVAVYLP